MVHKNPCDREMSNSGVLAGHSSFVDLKPVMEYLLDPRRRISFDTKLDDKAIPGITHTLRNLAERNSKP